jgi:hypothetical protein
MKKTMFVSLMVLGLIMGFTAARAADNAKTNAQILVEAKFIEKDAVQVVDTNRTGVQRGDVLSAPKITLLSGQSGTIKVVKELSIDGQEEPVELGVAITVTATALGSKVTLTGRASVSEKMSESGTEVKSVSWLGVRKSEVLFSVKSIGSGDIVVIPMQLGDRPVELQLEASVLP